MTFNKLTPPQFLVLSFASVILLGSLALITPWAAHSPTRYIDALFTSASAVCVTGLVVLDTGTHWTWFGQMIIMILIQVGGLGVMAFATSFALLLGRKIHLKERLIMQQAINSSTVGGVVRIFRYLLAFTFITETVGALILAIRFTPIMGIKKALWFGFFHSISAFNNAGFDLFGNFKSITAYTSDITINLVISTLIIIGGLGFYVSYELYHYRQTRILSLHTRVVLITTAALIIIGTIILLGSEYNHALKNMPLGTKLLAAYFQSVSPRTAGFNSIDLNSLFLSSQLFMVILMFIGASPGSTGGGIKTSTFTLLLAAMFSQLRGKKDTEIMERRIDNNDVLQALTLVMMATLTVILITFFVSLSYQGDFMKILFEVTSAFGTVGLSLGITTELNTVAKALIIATMLLGRVGPLTLGFALAYRRKQPDIRYAKGKIMIG